MAEYSRRPVSWQRSSSLLTALIASGSEEAGCSSPTSPASRCTTPTPPLESMSPINRVLLPRRVCIKFRCEKIEARGKAISPTQGQCSKTARDSEPQTPPNALGNGSSALYGSKKLCVDDILLKDTVFSRIGIELEEEESDGVYSDDEAGDFSSSDNEDTGVHMQSQMGLVPYVITQSPLSPLSPFLPKQCTAMEQEHFTLDEEEHAISNFQSRIRSLRKLTPQDIDPSYPSDATRESTPRVTKQSFTLCRQRPHAILSPTIVRTKSLDQRRCVVPAIKIQVSKRLRKCSI